MFVCRFEPKEKEKIKMIELQHKNIREMRKFDIAHEKFYLYCTNQNYKLQCTLDIYIYRIETYLDLICSLSRR
jgi:hypothetical protein